MTNHIGFTKEQIRKMHELRVIHKYTWPEIAKRYGCSKTTIMNYVNAHQKERENGQGSEGHSG
jgi:transposase